MDVKEILRQLVKKEHLSCIVGKVMSVDKQRYSCEVEPVSGEAPLKGVRIKAGYISGGLAVVPVKGSDVIVGFLNENESFLILCSEIDEIELLCEKITVNSGSNDGLVMVKPLTEKINAIEKDLNELKQIFSTTWIVSPTDGGGALKLAAATWAGQTITETEQSEIENQKIKH